MQEEKGGPTCLRFLSPCKLYAPVEIVKSEPTCLNYLEARDNINELLFSPSAITSEVYFPEKTQVVFPSKSILPEKNTVITDLMMGGV